ncbi:hypothetical protein SUDANB105_00776 [Streptomyces sp. enrichment culture]
MRVSTRGGESFLIGRQPVWNDERDLVVVSSAAQQAIEWRLATKEDPGDLLLRRKLAFQRRKPWTVTDFLDEFVLTHYHAHLDDGAATEEPLPVDVSDVPAEEGLRSAAGARATAAGVPSTPWRSGHPGCPGTGKTAVGLYRAMWLLDNQHCSAQTSPSWARTRASSLTLDRSCPHSAEETSPPSLSTASWPVTVPHPRWPPTPPRRPSSKVTTGWLTCCGGPRRRTAGPTVPEFHRC